MTRFILTLEMTAPMGGSILVGCGIVGDPGTLRGTVKQIGTFIEAEPILEQSIPQTALSMALTQLKSGFKTFVEISKEEALKLGVLEWTDTQ
jgi:hypothetical protein